jgi:hypothetical protein
MLSFGKCPPWLRGTPGGSYSGTDDHPLAPLLTKEGIEIESFTASPQGRILKAAV